MCIYLGVSDNPSSLYLNYLDLIEKCHRYDVKWVYADIEHNVGHDTSFGNYIKNANSRGISVSNFFTACNLKIFI
jgi:hypothetical protein